MREITIYQMKGDKFLVAETGKGIQTITGSHILKHLLEQLGHTGKDYKNTRKILNVKGNTTILSFKGA